MEMLDSVVRKMNKFFIKEEGNCIVVSICQQSVGPDQYGIQSGTSEDTVHLNQEHIL